MFVVGSLLFVVGSLLFVVGSLLFALYRLLCMGLTSLPHTSTSTRDSCVW